MLLLRLGPSPLAARASRLLTLVHGRIAKVTGGQVLLSLAGMDGEELFDAAMLGSADKVLRLLLLLGRLPDLRALVGAAPSRRHCLPSNPGAKPPFRGIFHPRRSSAVPPNLSLPGQRGQGPPGQAPLHQRCSRRFFSLRGSTAVRFWARQRAVSVPLAHRGSHSGFVV